MDFLWAHFNLLSLNILAFLKIKLVYVYECGLKMLISIPLLRNSRIISEHCKRIPANEVPLRERELSELDNCMSKMKTGIAKIIKDRTWKLSRNRRKLNM